jgi:aspartate aminotransferase-like enzyme
VLRDKGLALAVDPAETSCTLTTCEVPGGYSADQWFNANLEAGFLIYRCKGHLAHRFFQVANMGELEDDQIDAWVDFVGGLF